MHAFLRGIMRNPVLVFLALMLPAANTAQAGRETPRPTAKDKCPVCGMFVKKYPDWLAGIAFADGTTVFFDGAKDLFRFYHEPAHYLPSQKPDNVRSLFVTDYYGLTAIDARTAWYVLGSDVYGPMGKELIPFSSEAAAREFLKDHHATRVLRFSEVTPDVLRSLE
jgi:nitrous oxide reductase accessory protein NosL